MGRRTMSPLRFSSAVRLLGGLEPSRTFGVEACGLSLPLQWFPRIERDAAGFPDSGVDVGVAWSLGNVLWAVLPRLNLSSVQ